MRQYRASASATRFYLLRPPLATQALAFETPDNTANRVDITNVNAAMNGYERINRTLNVLNPADARIFASRSLCRRAIRSSFVSIIS